MADKYCVKHRMADGTIMDGPTHGIGQTCVEWSERKYKKGGKTRNPKFKGRSTRKPKPFSMGGMLVGPSHDNGGISALVDGTEPIEVEGGEFIINKQTVDAVGEEFLHKLNSTETTHHTGGYEEGVLPSPSKFKDGGKVNNRRNKMARGRRAPRRGIAPARRLRRGGSSTGRKGIRKFHQGAGINPNHSHAGGGPRKTTKRGHMTPSGRMIYQAAGGQMTSRAQNGQCKMYDGNETDCNMHPGCNWNPSTGMCH